MLQKRRSGWFSQGNAASRRSSQLARPRRALPELLEARQLLAVGAGITTPAMAIMNALSRSPSPLLIAPNAYSQPVVVVTSPTAPSIPGHGLSNNPSMSADSGPLAQADATDVAAIRLEVVDLNGNPLVSLTQGTQFQLRGYVRDLRTSNPQLSQAYVDVSFNSALASTVGNVTIGSAFPNSRAGETPSAGLLDEVGGIAVSPLASGESLLFSVTLQAAGPGLLTFTSNAADSLPAHNIITDTTVPVADVDYGSVSLMVQPTGDRDLVAFAKALKTANVKLYGAAWSSVTTEQKERFQDGAEFLDFIEVTNNNRTPNQVAITQNIATYPTWVFADGSRLIGLQTLEAISLQSGIPIPTSTAPSLAPIGTKEVLAGSPLLVALNGYDANGGPLTYTVTSDNPSIVAPTVFSGNRSMRISVAEFGDMVFELFENRVPRATQHIIQLAENGFFDGVVFHRILDQFVIQGGDPTGTGSGGSDLGDFKDQFDVDLQHNTDGILSMAKTSDDTSDSQFFITDIPNPAQGPPRHLDFNHTIFGFLTEGVSTRNNISGVAASSSGTPTIPVTMEEVSIFSDTENRVLLLKAPPNTTGTTNVTVTVTDQQGNSTSQTFQVNVKPDTINGNPFLKDFTQTFTTKTDTPIEITLEAIDVEGDAADFASVSGSSLTPTITVTNNKVSVTPPVGFAGTLPVLVGTFVDGGTPENSPIDTELVNISVLGVDLLSESDTGTSSTDNLTNAASLKIRVGGVPVGSTVKLLRNSQVVGTATATQADDGALFTYDASGQVGQLTFQAEYTLNNVTTPLEHVLTVNIDRVAPDPFTETSLNLTVKANKTIQHNVQHPQEGNGITYRLVSGPIASSIDTNTGIFNWSAGFPQANTTIPFTIQAVDAAGNSVDLPVSLTVTAPEPKAEFTVVVEDLSGNPLELIPQNTEFVVKVFVQDVRTDVAAADRHVFKAYADLLFDPAVATVTGPLTIGPQFSLPSGTNTQSGLIDEAGGTNSTVKTSDKMLLFSQRFTAATKGTFAFQTAKAVKFNAQNVATKEHDIGLGFTTTPDSREVTYGKATIRVTDGFNAFNDAPEVNEDSIDNILLVLANDSPGATITSVGTTNKGGTVTIAANQQSLIYTPAANYFGPETFTYTISNGTGGTNTATVDVFVVAQNDPPTAVADTFAAHGNSNSVLFRVQDNDLFTPDTTEPLTVTALTATSAGGTVVIATNGLGVRYTPPATTFVGTDTFTYTISDGKGGTSQALATINVALAVPSSPDLLAASDSGRSSTDNTTNATSLQFEVTGGLAGATIELFANGNSVGTSTVTDGKGTFTINASALSGDVAFTTKQTLNGATSDASAPLTVKIDRTVPGNFTSTLPEVIFVGVAATYDTQNSEEGSVTYGLVSAPTGAFIHATTGVMTWTPVLAQVGTASFTITATDVAGNVANHLFTTHVADDEVEFTVQVVDKNGSAITSVGTGSLFTVNVYARDIRPFLNDSFKGVMNAFVDLAFDDAKLDAVGAPVISSIFSDSNTSNGTLTTGRIDGVGGRNSDQKSAARQLVMSQQFRAIQTGSVTFQSEFAQAVDGSSNPTTAFNVTIFDQTIAVPQAAIQYGSAALTVVAGLNAVADTYQFNEDVLAQTLNILTNDATAPTSGALTIKSVTPSAQGNTIAIASGGQSLTYTPSANYHGAEVFQYTVEDESGAVSSATVTITVVSVNDPPTATADTVNVVQNSGAIEIDVLANDSFAPDTGETLSISAVTQGSLNGTVEIIASSKRLRYTPAANAIGTETFTYSLSDGNGGTVVGTVTANIRIAGPTGIDLVAASDSGTSSTDNITNGTTLQFQVQGVTTGAEVRVLAGTTVVGTTTATSSTATVSVDAAQLTGLVSFTAVQRLNGSDSIASPALNVTIDRVAPSTFQSTFPSIVFVALPVTANTANSEEGTIAYGLTSAPTGVTIDPSTGVFTWTPTVAQIGPQTFSITATDVAGNMATQVVNSRVVDDEVAFAVRLLDSNDAAITTIGTGSTFTMEVTVRDLRDFIAAADRGIFNAFVDINFDQTKLELVGNTQINPVFNDNNSGRPGTRTPGHIDGAGGINTDQKSSEAVWLARQQFRALAAGATTLQTAFAQDFEVNNQPTGNFDLALFGQTVPVPEVAVQYGAATLTIVQALSAINDSQQIVQGTTTTLDVLANDTSGPNSGALLIEFAGNGTTAGATSAGGTVAITQNGTRISYVPPAGFVGSDTFSYRIKDSLGNTSTAQVNLTLTVGAPSSVDLLAASDSGSSNSDNITNATQLSLEVSGVQNGAEVQILRDATVLGTGTAGSNGKATISINASELTGAVALTAKQKLNNVTSSASAPLTVTIDRVAPVAITSTAPTSATVGTQLTYNASHPDEGPNLIYSLVGAPTGAAINASTGELTWTPTIADVGTKSFTISAADLAGNAVTQPINLNVVGTQVAVTVRFVDHLGNVITKIGRDATFGVEVFVQDLRTNVAESTRGVKSAYVNYAYEANRAATSGVADVDTIFEDAAPQTGTAVTGGLNGVGGKNNDQNSAAPMRLVKQMFKATSVGSVTFSTSFATGTDRTVEVNGQTGAIPQGAIQFGTGTLTIEEGLTAVADTVQVTQDGNNTTISVLTNDVAGPTSSGLKITLISQPTNGTASIINNDTQISYKPKAGFFGTDTLNYTITDGTGATRQQSVTITVNQTTSVAGSVFFDTNNNGIKDNQERGLSNVEVKLDGTSTAGQAVHLTQRTDANGAYRFTSVAPGSYTVTQTQPGLVVNGGVLAANSYPVTTTLANPTVTGQNFTKASVAPKFAPLYALARTPATPVEVVTNLAGAAQWQTTDSAWSDYTASEIILSSDLKSITLNVTQSNGAKLTDTISVNDRSLLQVMGEKDGMRLVRILGRPADFSFTPMPTTTTGTSSSGTLSSKIDLIFANGGV